MNETSNKMNKMKEWFKREKEETEILLRSLPVVVVTLFMASVIPSNASDYTAFNNIFGGIWFILLGSTVAFLASAVLNNMLNWMIGRMLAQSCNEKFVYAMQTYISTFMGQLWDNFIFSVIVFVGFASVFWPIPKMLR